PISVYWLMGQEVVEVPQARKPEPEKYCEFCGVRLERKTFGDRLEDLSVFQRRKYCSLTCANSRKHPKHWTTYHLRAQKHRKENCEACGGKTSLQVHHIDQVPENNDPENLETLCKYCHDFWHATQKRLGRNTAGRMPSLF
ncbi:MAG TPA: HNH endonuclease signature motif containing protein, partial [Coriobacteriia bacterium]|nr:HNH endonuclease signature motif containing protein [Coriobacteriia bacterium]